MIPSGELAYKNGEIYRSQKEGCITDIFGCIDHHWVNISWENYFKKLVNHKGRYEKNY